MPDHTTTQHPLKPSTGIGCTRLAASVAVIIIHSTSSDTGLSTLINQSCRFAVPFFFAASGFFYFSRVNATTESRWLPPILRIEAMFGIWSIVYLADGTLTQLLTERPDIRILRNFNVLWEKNGWTLLFTGTAMHLWFLPSLSIAMLFTKLVITTLGQRGLFIVAFITSLSSLLLGPYSWLLNQSPSFWARNGFGFGFPCFCAGYLFRANRSHCNNRTFAISPSIVLLCSHLYVGYFISINSAAKWEALDFTLSSALFGIYLVPMGLANQAPATLSRIGQNCALTTYLVHPLILTHIQFLRPRELQSFWGDLIVSLALIAISFLVALGYNRANAMWNDRA